MTPDANTDGLSIDQESRGGAQVVKLRGEVDLHSSPRLRDIFLGLVEKGTSRLVVELSQVAYMDSSGVGTLVELKRKAERRGASVVLVAPQQRVMSLFEITQLDKFFRISPTVGEALQS